MTDTNRLSSTTPARDTADSTLQDDSRCLDRRAFLKVSSTAAAVALAGTHLASEAQAQDGSRATGRKSEGIPTPEGAAKDLKGGWFVV